jgi:dienelactone hydrolase
MMHGWTAVLALALGTALAAGAEKGALAEALAREIIGPRQSLLDLQDYLWPRIPRPPVFRTAGAWENYANRLRADVLDKIVFRGEAAAWRDAKTKVEWLDAIPGGTGYRIKKLRYEAVPGLWIPALLYEPAKLEGKVPVALAVNGHDRRNGKAGQAKQIRCINLAKRGMLVLNVEWLGMGQLNTESFQHYRMNQLDLCGTSGLAPFFLSMTRALDVLLGLPHADPERVSVSGLSGGGWQTIFVSSLDTRVTLANPVAGYTSFRVRIRDHFKDLGDSEQTPCDLATLVDYTHLTAMRAPRPTLLTYNAKDDCCFEAGYALPPLLAASRPVFQLYGKEKALRSHVNDDPGTHNFEKDNRQALYRMIGDFFYPQDPKFDPAEIPVEKEVKTSGELAVALPAENSDFNVLARGLARDLPRVPAWPTEKAAAEQWQGEQRVRLREVVRAKDLEVKADRTVATEKYGLHSVFWKLRLGDAWTVPVVELSRGEPKRTALLVDDAGRKAGVLNTERLLGAGWRVLAVDPFYVGESRLAQHDFLFALLLAACGERPLGVQASQLAAVARWSAEEHKGPVTVVAVGPRVSVAALVAAAVEPKAVAGLELHGAPGSLKEVIEQNRSVDQMPELFCFGLLEATEVKHLAALVAPRPVKLMEPGPRVKAELAGLRAWYTTLGSDFNPLP